MTLLSRVQEFSFPRFAGTEGERHAADLVADRFAAAGLDVRREPFRAGRDTLGRVRRALHTIVAGAMLFLSTLAQRGISEAWLIGACAILMILMLSSWRRGLERAFDGGRQIESQNVVGRRPASATAHGAASAAGTHEAAGPSAPHVVLLAHLDSKSTRFPTFWPASIVLASVLWLLVATALAALGAHRPELTFPRALVAAGWVLAVALVVVAWNPAGNESPGAMDNASGLAVLVALAEELPREDALREADLTFLATGAEEIGLAGAMRWIQAHERELGRARTAFVNIDSVGVGKDLLALDVRGRVSDGRTMRAVLEDAARASATRLRVLPFLLGVGVDTMPIGARGYPVASILGEVLGGASRRIHSARDTIEPLGEAGLAAALRLCAQVVRELSRSGAGTLAGGKGAAGVDSSALGGSRRSGE